MEISPIISQSRWRIFHKACQEQFLSTEQIKVRETFIKNLWDFIPMHQVFKNYNSLRAQIV
jgi:hypothetical protein